MSEDANPTDTTSFASILAGVSKLRGEGVVRTESNANNTSANATVKPAVTPVVRPNVNSTANSTTSTTPSSSKRPFDQNFGTSKAKVSPILVNKLQTDNPLLKSLVNVNWSYVESRHDYDYYVNNRNVLFLSLKYHKLKPEYITKRMKPLVKKDAILIFIIDVPSNYDNILRDINKICLYNEFTLLVAFSFQEAAKYLTFLAQNK